MRRKRTRPQQVVVPRLCSNVFEFKPGSRWGQSGSHNQSSAAIGGEDTALQLNKEELYERKKEVTLRGPREGRKSGRQADLKKVGLAKSLFGKKK